MLLGLHFRGEAGPVAPKTEPSKRLVTAMAPVTSSTLSNALWMVAAHCGRPEKFTVMREVLIDRIAIRSPCSA